jgi:3-oxoacyl-[acyl-carrier-protein] synthase II
VKLAGGNEAVVSSLSFAGFCAMRAVSTWYNDPPHDTSRQFNATSDGFVMTNGSGTAVLETLEQALKPIVHINCKLP